MDLVALSLLVKGGLLSRGSQVRVLPGVPIFSILYILFLPSPISSVDDFVDDLTAMGFLSNARNLPNAIALVSGYVS